MTRSRIDTALLLARTMRNLRPAQVLHRARLRALRFPPSRPAAASIISMLPPGPTAVRGWPESFIPLDLREPEGFPAPEDNAKGRFSFLNELQDLGSPVRWDLPAPSRLWTYHLHYMEWAWSFAAHPDRQWAQTTFADLWQSWQLPASEGRGDIWSPYVASVRAWVLCGVSSSLVAGGDVEREVVASLVRHARFLRWHLERDVGGNHLIKNLKGLVGVGVFLGDERLVARASKELGRQLAVQVLADGGHFERSPSYHCQVLGDLIDVAGLMAAAGHPPVPGIADAIQAMRVWLGSILSPDGDVPLFNDCVRVGTARVALLQPGPASRDRLTVLEPSGYVVMRPDDRLHLVADVGDACPPDLPAHAQADCLSFELSVDGSRVVVDPGTSTYAPGAQRSYERSTPAHNTVSIDDADQTEVWAIFRAARLAKGRLESASDDGHTIAVTGSHDGYRRLPGSPVHRRSWHVSTTGIEITDEILGVGEHRIESRVTLTSLQGCKVTWIEPVGLVVSDHRSSYATGFGRHHEARVMSARWVGRLPVTMRMELHATEPRLQGSGTDDDEQRMKGTT
jgi:uncharacterized heparinase superfamily protein